MVTIKVKLLSVLMVTLISCGEGMDTASSLEREDIENIWWQLTDIGMCFNIHESGDLLTYINQVHNEGKWLYEEPLTYIVDDDEYTIYENKNYIYIDFKNLSFEIEDCTLR